MSKKMGSPKGKYKCAKCGNPSRVKIHPRCGSNAKDLNKSLNKKLGYEPQRKYNPLYR